MYSFPLPNHVAFNIETMAGSGTVTTGLSLDEKLDSQ
jgi:hypothetical protein